MKVLMKLDDIEHSNKNGKSEVELLKDNLKILKHDISMIENYYKGKDSEVIVAKYNMYAEKLDDVIINYENYFIYTDNITSAFKQVKDDSNKRLSKAASEIKKMTQNDIINGKNDVDMPNNFNIDGGVSV